ncbi:MT-A70 family methyltransferase, partial [Escherichia coli]|uniref:MT-A70 family methyltransferase n=1 Tax=Escherichia coli TaxID=562 RepID=UPI00207505D3
KLIMLPSETMIWQPEFTDKTLSRKTGAVQNLPERINAGIIQSFTAPRLDHSRKPDMAREKLVQLLGDVPRIELFARHTSHGFDVWGNQCGTPSIEMVPGIVKFLEKTNERKNDVDKGITS